MAVRARSLEWVVRHKAGDTLSPVSARSAILDPGENRKTILAGLKEDRDRLVADIRKECGHLPSPVCLGIPASWVLLRITELPSGSPDELASMTELQVDKFSPFPVDESAISYELLADQEGRSRLLLSAIRTSTLDDLSDGLRAAGIKPKWVDINLLGWWQLLKDAGKVHQAGSQVFLILEDSACDIIVSTAGVPVAMRSLSGMEDLPPGETDEEIARETIFTLSSLDLDPNGSHLAEISIWHHGDAPTTLLDHLAAQFSVVAHPHSLDTLPSLAEGLLRRAESRTRNTMDLAPKAWQETAAALRTRRRVIASSILVAGLWLFGMAVLFGGIQIQKQQLSSMERELVDLKGPSEKVRAIRDRTQDLLKYLDRSRSGLECLREISDRLPPGIELRSFTYYKNKTLEITGQAETYSLVADFKKDLEHSELFSATELPRTRHVPQGEEFKIICKFPGGDKP